ncbi:hypothetical protein D3C72_1608300 [compost metagenome]
MPSDHRIRISITGLQINVQTQFKPTKIDGLCGCVLGTERAILAGFSCHIIA